ncbi:MAG TPA: hypothetical protein VGN12_24505 [Pirellulales bacterium]|jgi:hypothetical protein
MSLFAALLATQIVPFWAPTPDGAGYLSIARSIAHGGPVENMGSPKLHYAPGYPLLISPAFWFGDRPFLLLQVLQWLWAVAFMLEVYRWAQRWMAGSELWITALTMSNVSLWIHARTTISEMPFMALLVWTANAMDRLSEEKTPRGAAYWSLLIAALTVALSMIRPVGILVLTGYAVVVFLKLRRGEMSWRRAIGTMFAIGTPAAVAIMALLVYEARNAAATGVRGDPTYLHEFRADDMPLPVQLLEGVRVRASEVGRLLVPGMNKSYAKPFTWLNANMLIYIPLFFTMAWAWWNVAGESGNTLLFMLPCYLALYIVYPSDQGTRYLLPLLPVLVACLWWFVWYQTRHRTQILTALVVAHLLVAFGYSTHSTLRLARLNDEWRTIDSFASIMNRDTRPSVCWNAPFGIRELEMVATDRWCAELRGADTAVPPEAGWIVTAADSPNCPGFVERAREGDLKLLARVQHVSQFRSKSPR